MSGVRLFRVGYKPDYHDGGIPWSVIAPHELQARRNHGQSLERIHARGGLVWSEALAVLEDREWASMDREEARRQVEAIVARATQEAEHG